MSTQIPASQAPTPRTIEEVEPITPGYLYSDRCYRGALPGYEHAHWCLCPSPDSDEVQALAAGLADFICAEHPAPRG